MKRLQTFLLPLAFSLCFACSTNKPVSVQGEHQTYEVFIEALSPYGTWMESSVYGIVWHPYTDPSFRPYLTNGHWVATTEGWAWKSDYKWGWAAFHYGRWYYDTLLGWLWQPGYEWAPAWVTWGYADDYYCWAPLMPGVIVTLSSEQWKPPQFYWNGCKRRHIANRNLEYVSVKPEDFADIRRKIKPLYNFGTTHSQDLHYATGPVIDEVNLHVPRRIRRVPIADRKSPARSKVMTTRMQTYRPDLRNSRPATAPAEEQK